MPFSKVGLLLVLTAVAFVPGFAHAFTLQGTDSNLRGWNLNMLQVKVSTEECSVSADVLNGSVDRAFALWNSISDSGIKLYRSSTANTVALADYYTGATTAQENGPVIFCSSTFSTVASTDGDQIVGLGYARSEGAAIIGGFMVLNSEAGKAADILKISEGLLDTVIAHEMGHVLGLGHSQDTKALMNYNLAARTILSVSKDDADGLRYLYPRNEVTNPYPLGCGTVENRGEKRGGGGASVTGGPGGPSGMAGAVSYLAMFMFAYWVTRKSHQIRG